MGFDDRQDIPFGNTWNSGDIYDFDNTEADSNGDIRVPCHFWIDSIRLGNYFIWY